jgi:hypothetical protein
MNLATVCLIFHVTHTHTWHISQNYVISKNFTQQHHYLIKYLLLNNYEFSCSKLLLPLPTVNKHTTSFKHTSQPTRITAFIIPTSRNLILTRVRDSPYQLFRQQKGPRIIHCHDTTH